MGRKRTRTGLAGHIVNPPGDSAALDVGKFVVNFSAVDFAVYMWIAELSTDDAVLECCVGAPMSKRLEIVEFLVDRAHMPKSWKTSVRALWSKVQWLSEERNRIAHNPILFVWKNRPADGPADFIGIPDVRHLRKKHGGQLPTVDTLSIRPLIDETAQVAQELVEKLDAFRGRVSKLRRKKGSV